MTESERCQAFCGQGAEAPFAGLPWPTPLLLAFALHPVSAQGAAALALGLGICYFEILKH